MSGFEKVIGYEDLKRELERMCDVLCKPEKYAKLGVKVPKGLFLCGDPGVGKTLIANCIIEATERKSFICRKKQSDKEFLKEIVDTFDKAKKLTPSVILLDDMDKYANEDDEHKNAEIFVTLQSCIDEAKNFDVFVVATANELENIPSSLLRPGRFDKLLGINNPEGEDVEKIVEHYLSQKNYISNVNAREIGRILAGHSCAELETVINEAGIYAGFENKEAIDMQDILKACLRIIFKAPEKTIGEEKEIIKIAYHEAGHAIISEFFDRGSVELVTVQGNHGKIGGFTKQRNLDGYWYSKKMMENRVISILGGKAATEIVFGNVDVGANNDLHRAFDIVERFVDDYCSYGFDKWIQTENPSNDLLSRREMQISSEMERLYTEAKNILLQYRKVLDKLANILVKEKTLIGSQVREILSLSIKK